MRRPEFGGGGALVRLIGSFLLAGGQPLDSLNKNHVGRVKYVGL